MMAKQQGILWTTEKVRLGDLVEWEHNPVKLSKHDAQEIENSLRKFGMVLPLVANAPLKNGKRRLLDGHQRKPILLVLSKLEGEDAMVDVRVPSRQLTDRECDEITIRLRRNTGKLDYDMLAQIPEWDAKDFLDIGFEEDELAGTFLADRGKETTAELKPFKYARVLISFPIDLAISISEMIDKIQAIDGVEVDYGSN
jgi:hypothetical protein